MGHKTAEAIIEDGKITYIDHTFPSGKVRVTLIYDINDVSAEKSQVLSVIRETGGIYPHIRPDTEARALRSQWERDV
jgi:hypothetical protein